MCSVLRNRYGMQLSLLVILISASVALSGCAPSESDQASPSTTAAPAPAEQPVNDVPTVTTDIPEAATPAEEVPMIETPAEEKPAEVTPTEEMPAEENPVEVTPAEEKPAEVIPAEEKPAEMTPAEEKSVEVTPAEEKPAEVAPAEEKPAEEKPVEVTPAEENPAEEKPADVTPAEEKPAEEKPAEVAPAAEKPAESEPAAGGPTSARSEGSDMTEGGLNPTAVPTVEWMPEPIENVDAVAADAGGMKPYTEELPDSDMTFDMVPIPGGKFLMGSPEGEADRKDDEGPQHEVEIEPFWMGKYEVTWNEYELWGVGLDQQRRKVQGKEPNDRDALIDAIAMPTKPYSDMTFGMGKDGYPAICMTQLAARTYCKWLSAKTGRFYRLPTEAEWEYACRAGTTTAYSFGDDPKDLDDYAWHFENSEDGYHKVGLKKPNPWGLYDIHGNVAEWVTDQYVPDFYQQFTDKLAKGPVAPAVDLYPRVARGGCWDDDPDKLRSAARAASSKDWKMQDPQIPQSIWYLTEVYCPGIRVVRPLKVPSVEEAKLYEPDYSVIEQYKKDQAGKE